MTIFLIIYGLVMMCIGGLLIGLFASSRLNEEVNKAWMVGYTRGKNDAEARLRRV